MGRPSAAGQRARDIQSVLILLVVQEALSNAAVRQSIRSSVRPVSCPCDLNVAFKSFIVFYGFI